MRKGNKLLKSFCIALSIAVVSGLVYGALYPFPNLQTRAISWLEIEQLMGSERGANIKRITCVCRFFPTPDTNSLIVELKTPACERTISESELVPLPVGTNCGILIHRKRTLFNKRLAWLFEQAKTNGVDLTLKAHAPVNGNKYVTADLIKDGKCTDKYTSGLAIAGPQSSKAPWLN